MLQRLIWSHALPSWPKYEQHKVLKVCEKFYRDQGLQISKDYKIFENIKNSNLIFLIKVIITPQLTVLSFLNNHTQ